MHRRQYIPGSDKPIKVNRKRLHAENQRIKERLTEYEAAIAHRDEELQKRNRHAIARGWRALVVAVKRFFSSPVRLPRRKAA